MIKLDARVSAYNGAAIRILGLCIPSTGQVKLQKIMPFDSQAKQDDNTIIVTDSPQIVQNWQLAFNEKAHLDEVIKTYLMRYKNGLIRIEKELERFNPQTVIATRKIDKNGAQQELNSDSLENGHVAILLAVWASAKASMISNAMGNNANQSDSPSGLMMPFSLVV